MRVLGAIRQSKTKDRAISPTDQRRRIMEWAQTNGHEVVKITEDLSVSGKMSAFKRPELGPWLTDPERVATWDILVATKLDRAFRNTADYLKVREWAEHNRKRIVLLDNPDLDTSTASGKAMGTIQAAFAEFERDMGSERAKDRVAELKEQGRWGGGVTPFGYRADKRADGFYLVPDENGNADIAREMAQMAIDGKSNAAIQRWLNSEGIATSRGKRWRAETVRQVLMSPNMEGLVTQEQYDLLRHAMVTRKVPARGQWTSDKHILLRVAFCTYCKEPLYAAESSKRSSGGYYRCVNPNTTCRVHAPINKLESDVTEELKARWGNRRYQVRRIIPGDDHAKEIARLERQLEQASQLEFVDTSPLEAEIARLRALPHEADQIKLVDMDETTVEHWNKLDTAGKGKFLRDNGVIALVGHGGAFVVESTWRAEWNVPRLERRR